MAYRTKRLFEHFAQRGIEFFLLTNPVQYLGNDKGRLTGMECLKMELGEPDASGRRRPVPVKGSEFKLDCDLCIVAVGTGPNPLVQSTTPDLVQPARNADIRRTRRLQWQPRVHIEQGQHQENRQEREAVEGPLRP